MKVAITRVRNEEKIIKHTLDHVGKLVDAIYVYDDFSTDKTAEICNAHPKVVKVIRGKEWASEPIGRSEAEGTLRQAIYEEALKCNPEWVYYFDADELADFSGIDFKADAYRLRLFDFYITEEDKDTEWYKREWMGSEYRDILMLFKPHPKIRFDCREPNMPDVEIKQAGFVKHYGKAISVEEWDKTCDYYINNRGGNLLPMFTDKWKARKGKAIHTQSDFGNPLIKWEDKHKGIKLNE